MNNKRSPIEQFLLIALLGFAAFTLSQQFFGPNKDKGDAPARTAPALSKAFDDLNPAGGKEAALNEITELQKKIEANSDDEYAAWAHLRIGLLKQYVLRNATEAREEYEIVANRNQHKDIDAQALYQKGDMLWRLAESGKREVPAGSATGADNSAASGNTATAGNAVTATPGASTSLTAEQIKTLHGDAAYALEQIQFRARGDKAFLESKIFVPDQASHRGDPLSVPREWQQLSLAQLRGDLNSPDTRGILTRVDTHYSRTPALYGYADLYGLFDTVVKWFGAQPSYSYGLALLLLAVVTRVIMQPLIKKQYDSMKGMSLIAPEMKKIQEKYKGKSDQASQMKMMAEIRALQKAHGVNPMGCGLSMLIQMPVFFFFVLPLINHYQAKLELTGANFGWIQSLARPDIPLLVLYAISMFISVRLSSMPPTDDQQKQMQKITTLMSPMFALVLWSYPSAFILYWLTYNVVSMVFQWRMMKKSDPGKDLIKTLIGTAQPATALAGDPSTPAGALPARPKSEKLASESSPKSSGNAKPVIESSGSTFTSTSESGVSPNGAASNGTGKTSPVKTGAAKSGGGSQRARRRRR